MVERSSKAGAVENFRITEINARFSFNGYLYQAYGQLALYNLGMGRDGIMPATDSIKVKRVIIFVLYYDEIYMLTFFFFVM